MKGSPQKGEEFQQQFCKKEASSFTLLMNHQSCHRYSQDDMWCELEMCVSPAVISLWKRKRIRSLLHHFWSERETQFSGIQVLIFPSLEF
jgi:hypothetical protein